MGLIWNAWWRCWSLTKKRTVRQVAHMAHMKARKSGFGLAIFCWSGCFQTIFQAATSARPAHCFVIWAFNLYTSCNDFGADMLHIMCFKLHRELCLTCACTMEYTMRVLAEKGGVLGPLNWRFVKSWRGFFMMQLLIDTWLHVILPHHGFQHISRHQRLQWKCFR